MSSLKEISQRLKKYMSLEAISRYEEEVVTELKKNMPKEFKVSRDNLGSVIFYKKSKVKNAPKLMIAAHMDEVGYLVRSVEENGNVLVKTVGGVWPNVVIGTKAKLKANSNGKVYTGIFGHTSIHILEREKFTKAILEKELFVDFGFTSKKQVEEAGIEVGDPIYLSGEYLEFPNDLVAGKAMDNRAGVTALELVGKALAKANLNCDLYLVGTAQEEVGTRGAKTSVTLINPDVAIALDTGAAHDSFGAPKGTPSLGKGVALLVLDGGTLPDTNLLRQLMQVAKKHKLLAYKYIAEGGGTDAAELQYAQGGAATITTSIPQRYLHSPLGMASLVDIKHTVDLLVKYAESFSDKHLKELKFK